MRFPLSSAFTREIVMVPNRGMERWLSMQLAEKLGVWANALFLLPNSFADELFRCVFPTFQDTPSIFDPDLLTWKIMYLLSGAIVKNEVFSQLDSYLTSCPGDTIKLRRRYQLSAKIADIFDQYTIYRPEMVLDWEKGHETHWQAALWREITRENKTPHRSRLWKDFFASIKSLDSGAAGLLPERVIAFGLSSLPPYHTGLLAAIASRVPVYLFVLNPSAEYWDNILS
jgi:exodeoxyribonuclease V gamma subunit